MASLVTVLKKEKDKNILFVVLSNLFEYSVSNAKLIRKEQNDKCFDVIGEQLAYFSS